LSDYKINSLLASLSPGDIAALLPYLKSVELRQNETICEAGEKFSAVYFPTGAVVSLVVSVSSGETIEAAMVGKDGVVGASAALDSNISFCRAIIQLSGTAMLCDQEGLKAAVMQSHTLLSKLIRHEQALYAQAQQSAACLATHHVEARLCRWLLRARDLVDNDTLPFTQEFLAEMLGVRRTSVTEVAGKLQQAGLIRYARGTIKILNIAGLRDATCECYEAVKEHHRVLLGPKIPESGTVHGIDHPVRAPAITSG
jgi:CRP-like cAMP-binding protein